MGDTSINTTPVGTMAGTAAALAAIGATMTATGIGAPVGLPLAITAGLLVSGGAAWDIAGTFGDGSR